MFKAHHISHVVAVLILVLIVYTEHRDGVRETINIFLFLELSLEVESEAALMARFWDTAFDINMITTHYDTSYLI